MSGWTGNSKRKLDQGSSPLRGFVVSLDFELLWGVLANSETHAYTPNILGAREVIPKLLSLFRDNSIACTWATVGFLFFDDKETLSQILPAVRPRYSDTRLDAYKHIKDIGVNEAIDPLHFGRSLIQQIQSTPRQEIGTHTFSHYFCLDAERECESLDADLKAARAAASREGADVRSIVFPRNQVCDRALAAAERVGLSAFRGAAPGWCNTPQPSHRDGLLRRGMRLVDAYVPLTGSGAVTARRVGRMVDVPASRFLRPYSTRLKRLEPLRLARIRRGMRAAAASQKLYHLWFHPHNFGVNQERNLEFLAEILREAAKLDREFGWPSLTMGEVAEQVLEDPRPCNQRKLVEV